jgi:hypothetical protein
MYLQFAVQSFKDVSSLVFEDGKELSMIGLLYGDDFYLIIEVFAFDEFLKDLFVIYFPKYTIRIFIDDIECIVVEFEERLIEESLFEIFSCLYIMGKKIMTKRVFTDVYGRWFILISSEKLLERFIDCLSLETHPDLLMWFESSKSIYIMFSIVEFEEDTSDILHATMENFLYFVVEDGLGIMEEMFCRISD